MTPSIAGGHRGNQERAGPDTQPAAEARSTTPQDAADDSSKNKRASPRYSTVGRRSRLGLNARIAKVEPRTGRDTHSPRSPAPLNASVSAQMSRMPRSSTKPELDLRRELHRRGLRFTVNRRDLPGTPDVVFSRARLAVFVDGCFWHGCLDHGVLPKNNREWWRQKLEANRQRDESKDRLLVEQGWHPVHLWEHVPADEMADIVEQLWRDRVS